jgi:hypothetical protein
VTKSPGCARGCRRDVQPRGARGDDRAVDFRHEVEHPPALGPRPAHVQDAGRGGNASVVGLEQQPRDCLRVGVGRLANEHIATVSLCRFKVHRGTLTHRGVA